MNVNVLYVTIVIGVMNIKPIMRYGCAIDAMPFIVNPAMKWINVKIVEKSCVPPVLRSCRVNFVEEDSVKIVRRRVDGTFLLLCELWIVDCSRI